MRDQAVYLNGVFESVLEEIVEAQSQHPYQVLFMQPHSPYPIVYLRDNPPSPGDPVRLYASITSDLQHVRYTADIVSWRDKSQIPHGSDLRKSIEKTLDEYQPGEGGLYNLPEDGFSCNLLYVAHVKRLESPFRVDRLILKNESRPLSGNRTTPGHWAYVLPEPATD